MIFPTEVFFITVFVGMAVLAILFCFFQLSRLVYHVKTIPLENASPIKKSESVGKEGLMEKNDHEINKLNQLVLELEQTRMQLEEQKARMEEALLMVEKDNFRKTEELLEAQQLQLAMLPQHTPFFPGYEIALYSQPASEVGGDYYDYRFCKSNKILNMVLGDATGHGFKPAILVATAKSYFQTLSGRTSSEDILKRLSEAIQSLNAKGFYMGLSLLELDGDLVSLLSTGMPPVYFFDAKKRKVERHLCKGMFLGVRKVNQGQKKVFRMHKGDVLLLMTDGLAECRNRKNELLGYEAIAEEFERKGHDKTSRIFQSLMNLGESWSEGCQQQDDISLIVIKRT